MAPTTIRNKPKAFAWSYSKIKNYETCPKRYYAIDVTKQFKEAPSEHLEWGDMVHKALAARIASGTPLPDTMEEYEPWAKKIIGDGSGTILVEQKLALDANYGPCKFFDNNAWFRGIGDVIKIAPNGRTALIVDWKTGKILEDGTQLALMAACVFAHHPTVEAVRSEFIWLKEDATTRDDFRREDMKHVWRSVLPRVDALKHAHDQQDFPPKPGGLCRRWCIVTSCPHQGGD